MYCRRCHINLFHNLGITPVSTLFRRFCSWPSEAPMIGFGVVRVSRGGECRLEIKLEGAADGLELKTQTILLEVEKLKCHQPGKS